MLPAPILMNTHKSPCEPLLTGTLPELDVVVEVPRGSFLKRGSTGHVDFISPIPCPFNYGAVPKFLGLEGDLLDAVVLGPRLKFGSRLRIKAWGAITLMDRGMVDDKMICCENSLSKTEIKRIERFFRFYAKCKGVLNVLRHSPGCNTFEGWIDPQEALSRARPRDPSWIRSPVNF